MKTCLSILVLLVVISCTQKKENPPVKEPIDIFMDQTLNEFGIVGVGALIIIDKKVTWMKGYGYSDREKKIPFTPTTIMNIGSISKTVTGASLMRAIEDKKVSLDEDINRYLPFKVINPYYPKTHITLRNLATHTSNINDRSPIYGDSYHYGDNPPEPLGDFLKNYFSPDGKYYSKDNFLNAQPGRREQYSNIGAGLAGYVIEVTTGEKLNAYSKRNIFEPLGMNDTGWFLSEIKLENHSKLYELKDDSIQPIQLYSFATYPDGGLRTSISDLSKFFICMLNDGESQGTRILKKESVQEMVTPQFTESTKPDGQDLAEASPGLFWWITNNSREGHNGGDPGVMTQMKYDRSKQVGVIFFINTSPKDADKAMSAIEDALWSFALRSKEGEPVPR